MRAYLALPFLTIGAVVPACGSSNTPQEACATSAEEALNVCAAGSTVKGMDVSTYQDTIDWTKVKPAGIDFAFARISDGTANPDNQFKANWEGMKANGIVRGAYQYWRASVDPTAQANVVVSSLKAAGGYEATDLPVVMDIETADGASAATIEANMKTWLAAVQAGTGKKPIIYTSEGTYPISATTYDSYDLWVANYTTGCPVMPVGWTKWVFWQNTDSLTVAGVPTAADGDYFNGSLAQLTAYAGAGAADAGSGSGSGGADAGSSGKDAGAGGHDAGAGSSSGSTSGSGSGAGSGSGGSGDAGSVMGAGGGGDAGAKAGSSSGASSPCGK